MIKNCSSCNTTINVKPCRNKADNYCSNTCQMVHQYANGRQPNTSAANLSIVTNGNPKLRGKPAAWLGRSDEATVRARISASKTGVAVPKLRKAETKDKSYWKSAPYQAWRKAVMRRDNFTCIECGDNRGGNLEADHIKPVFLFPELMLNESNGRTLCKPCHKATPTWGAKVRQLTREHFIGIEG